MHCTLPILLVRDIVIVRTMVLREFAFQNMRRLLLSAKYGYQRTSDQYFRCPLKSPFLILILTPAVSASLY